MISAILLTAGQSKRMRGQNKLTKKINGLPLIKYSIKNILASKVDEVIVVLGYQKNIIKKIIGDNKKIKFIFNDNFKSGMASSIKVGLKHLSKKTLAFFICLGDMPMVNKNIYNKLIKSRKNKKIVIPVYNNQKGNPVLFSKSMKKKIINIHGDVGAKKIIESIKNNVKIVKIKSKSVILDFNTEDNTFAIFIKFIFCICHKMSKAHIVS